MRGIEGEGEQVLLRVILSESRMHDRQPLFRRLLDLRRVSCPRPHHARPRSLLGLRGRTWNRSVWTMPRSNSR